MPYISGRYPALKEQMAEFVPEIVIIYADDSVLSEFLAGVLFKDMKNN